MSGASECYRGGICLRCGAIVGDPGVHDRWHDGMCGHRDSKTGYTCMNRPPCNGPHGTDFSPYTWDTAMVSLVPDPHLPLGTLWTSRLPTA